MKLTKDEAWLLGTVLQEGKYAFNDSLKLYDRRISKENINLLQVLEDKLIKEGKDQRRVGRTSNNDFNDKMKRLKKKYL